jgi:hypothetical protein
MRTHNLKGFQRIAITGLLIFIRVALSHGQVMKEPDDPWIKSFFHLKMGNLWFNSIRLDYPGMKTDLVMTDSLPLYNAWDRTMTLDLSQTPPFVTVRAVPPMLAPHQQGMLYITYDAAKKGTYGPTFDSFYMITNDTVKPDKSLIVCPDIREDFSALTPKQLLNAPVIVFDDTTFNFGTATAGTPVEHSFTFRNTGRSDLIIRNVVASCGCTATEAEKEVLKPGEESHVDAIFDTGGLQGLETKTITVIANVPSRPETVLTLTGMIR